MSLSLFHIAIISGWLIVVTAALGIRIALGGPPAFSPEGLGWLVVGTVPVVLLLMIFRGAPPPTIGEVLYSAEHPSAAPATMAERPRTYGDGRRN